ncbi:MAG: glycosyltransferase family 4 protein [Lachnospiraceae bacterium]|nr:glycosyltransferase family 4 protein [Lachnospiraceae bacterium]
MKLFVATDFRTVKCRGRFYLASQYFYIIKRYREQFGSVVLCSRYIECDETEGLFNIDDLLDGFIGVKELSEFLTFPVKKKIEDEVRKCDMVVGRYPSFAASVSASVADRLGKTMYAEVMADPWDAYWNHSLKGKIIAPLMFLITKKNVKGADYALYVTEEFLQRRYPTRGKNVGVSDVMIDRMAEERLNEKLENLQENVRELTLMTTAAVDVAFKGQQYVIKAIPILNRFGIRVKYCMVGGGNPERLKKIADKYGISEQVKFLGVQTLDKVIDYLDQTDIYVQPSLQEGLPRALVEAMSRGCVCLGACTGGIPELLPEECIFARKSAKAIARSIIKVANKKSMFNLAKQNYEKAKKYEDAVLSEKRNAFYNQVKKELGFKGV